MSESPARVPGSRLEGNGAPSQAREPASLPEPVGPLSSAVVARLRSSAGGADGEELLLASPVSDALADDDLQLALYLCYELHYTGFAATDPRSEWDPELIRFRGSLEEAFLAALRSAVPPRSPDPSEVGKLLFELADESDGPSLSAHLEWHGTETEFREFVVHRSAYQLKEADPHTWAIPRLSGPPKAAMAEIQADEYGGGRPERMHSALFAKTMRALGLDDLPGAYLDLIPGLTLATVNLISLFGLNRRWRGALVGHLAMFEMTSSQPNRRYANGIRRLGFGADATDFYDEHVEADAVHENIAAYDMAGALARREPELAAQIVFGAECLLELDRRQADRLLSSWSAGRTSLREALREHAPSLS
jgi:hypothetical protein